MPKIARRFTIVTLLMTIFALSFSALITETRSGSRIQAGKVSLCDSRSLGTCGAFL